MQAPFAIGLTLAVAAARRDPRHERRRSTRPARRPRRSSPSSWALGQLWLFWVAPLVGAALAGLVYRAFAAEPVEDNLLEEDDAYVTTDDVLVVDGALTRA